MTDIPRPFILIHKLFQPGQNFVEDILQQEARFTDSKFGTSVNAVRKRRRDMFLDRTECAPIDEMIFRLLKPILEKEFGISIRYRERYKIGHYSESDQGYYTPHSDIQGGMEYRRLSMVICFSRKEDYEGGEFTLVDLHRSFRFDYGDAVVFDSSLTHGVSPVTKGDRKVLISFFLDDAGGRIKLAKSGSLQDCIPVLSAALQQSLHSETVSRNRGRYMFCIPPNSGPGNQIVSVKEAYVMARLLERRLMLPPINQHYTKENRLYWDFNELFRIDGEFCLMPDLELVKGLEKCFLLHAGYSGRLRLEQHLDLNLENELVEKRVFRNPEDLNALQALDDELLCIKHAFNSVRFNTSPFNGAPNAPVNRAFEPWYREICERLDFSPTIHRLADSYLETEDLNDFIAVHLRYPDVMNGKALVEHAGFSEADIHVWLLRICEQHGFNAEQIFIATNKPGLAMASELAQFRFYPDLSERAYGSFVEQCICSRARLFIMSPWNDYTKMHEPWQRSTWSALVHEHRMYRQKLPPTQDILLLS